MIDATHLKAHRTAASLLKKGPVPLRVGRTKGGLNSKLHAVCDGQGRPLIMLLSEGQMSDYKGAALMLDAFPRANLFSATKAMTPTGSTTPWPLSTSQLASRPRPTAKRRSHMTRRSTASATRSRICSVGSRTGDASTPATIAAPTPSCPPYASEPPSSSGSDQ
jgi:transposase